MKIGKIWGNTRQLLKNPFIEVHLINIHPNSHCSLHAHKHKWNMFFVVYGELDIEVHKNDYELVDVTRLRASESTTVSPGEYHRFKTNNQGCQALEIYYLSPIQEDIIRKDVGGIEDKNA